MLVPGMDTKSAITICAKEIIGWPDHIPELAKMILSHQAEALAPMRRG
jgi:hypothetical protein